jgi:hypothetical protein
MSFWYDKQLQPKRAYKFLLSINGGNTSIKEFLIKKVTKPSFSVSQSEHKYLNHTFYYPGKVTWNEVSFTVVDVVDQTDDATAAVMSIFAGNPNQAGDTGMGYQSPVTSGVTSTISKDKSVAAMGNIIIRQIDSEGRNVEAWKLHNAWIKDVKFGDLDYGSEEMLNVDVTLVYDTAICETKQGRFPANAISQNLL